MSIVLYPLLILRYYFFEIPFRLIRFFISLNMYLLDLFSVPVLLATFFKPLKNEYRKDLVAFSIGMGIVVKTFLLILSLALVVLIVCLEIALFIFLYAGPVYFLLSFYW